MNSSDLKAYYKLAEELSELATRVLQQANKYPKKDYQKKIIQELEDVRNCVRKLEQIYK